MLQLVAAGNSNGEIGSALFISTKTASVHVSNILAKLGVSGRGEAAGAGVQARAGLGLALCEPDGHLDGDLVADGDLLWLADGILQRQQVAAVLGEQ